LAESQLDINNRLNQFAWRLFSEAYAQNDEGANVLISPLSLEVALGMFQNGLTAADQQEMLKTMGLEGYTSDEVNAYFKTMIAGIVEADEDATLEIANSFWYRNSMTISPAFQQALENNFDAKVQDAPFDIDGSTIAAINQWCAEKTHQLITEMLSIDNPVDVFALLNAVYFKAGWNVVFDKEKTDDMPFSYADGTVDNLPMMVKEPLSEGTGETFFYQENEEYQAFAMPFKNEAFVWFAFLPREGKNIAETLPLITDESLSSLTETRQSLLRVAMPKYEVSHTASNLVKIIDALNPDLYFKYLDFQNAFDSLLPPDMEIDALQKAVFKVSEEGAEAAAVTSITGITSVIEYPSIILDRPFIYGIMETSTGCPLFIGNFGDKPQ